MIVAAAKQGGGGGGGESNHPASSSAASIVKRRASPLLPRRGRMRAAGSSMRNGLERSPGRNASGSRVGLRSGMRLVCGEPACKSLVLRRPKAAQPPWKTRHRGGGRRTRRSVQAVKCWPVFRSEWRLRCSGAGGCSELPITSLRFAHDKLREHHAAERSRPPSRRAALS